MASKLGKVIVIPVPEGLDADSALETTQRLLRREDSQDIQTMADSARLIDLEAMKKPAGTCGIPVNDFRNAGFNAALRAIGGEA